jgi:hypothetical protein
MSHFRRPDSHLRQEKVARSFQKKHPAPAALQVEHSLGRSQGLPLGRKRRVAHLGDASTSRSSAFFFPAAVLGDMLLSKVVVGGQAASFEGSGRPAEWPRDTTPLASP